MSVIPCIYIFLQIVLLFLLRKVFLMTVYQTVAAYGAVCLAGLGLMALSDKSPRRPYGLAVLRDSYLIFWSGVHGVIVLGILTMGSYYLTLTQITLVQIVNIFLGIALYWILYLVLGRTEWAIGWGNFIIGLVGTVNHYLMRFRGAPFQLSDIKAAKTAGNVVQNYDFTPIFCWQPVCWISCCGIWSGASICNAETKGGQNPASREKRAIDLSAK